MRNTRIRFLRDMAANSKGETVKVELEDEEAVYYTDGWNRWSYLLKSEEGIDFVYTQYRKEESK
jgi:hypothetical protein